MNKPRIDLTSLLARLPKKRSQAILKSIRDPGSIQNVGLWLSAVAASVVSILLALAFRRLEAIAIQWQTFGGGYWGFLISPILFLAAWWVVYRYAPPASGSGIPQILAANEINYDQEPEKVDRLLALRVMWIKILSSLLCLAGGGAIGREGPTLQVSASVFHFFGRNVRKFVGKTSEQTWIVAGAAAGLAAAFNTPLGGIVYAIEELGVVHFHRIRMALISAVIVSGVVAQWLLGSYLYLGFPPLQNIGFTFLPWALLAGAISGYLGACFGFVLARLSFLRLKTNSPKMYALYALIAGLCMAALIKIDPRAHGTGLEVMTGFLFRDEKSGVLLVALRWIGTTASYLSGAAGGIFSPSLAIGATIGGALEQLFGSQHPNLMVLLGMIGFLTGMARTPFTSFILVLEMTDRHSAIFPMMLAALAAQSAALLVDDHSFYEIMKNRYL